MDPVSTVRDRVARAQLGGERVLVACSGGPDSMTLLDALHALGQVAFVASVDHQLRGESSAEAEGVHAFAAAIGIPAAVLKVTVPRVNMAAARAVRYQALVAHAASVGATVLAVGHTATDQAETLLDRMVRGVGTKGLSAMARDRLLAPGLRLVRPLLDVTSEEVEAYVAARKLSVVRDPTNRNLGYRRSRLRHEVLPLLRRERGDLDRGIAALCDRLRQDAEALDAEAHLQWRAMITADWLDARRLQQLPLAIAARVVSLAAGISLEAVHVEAVLRLCRELHGTRSLNLPAGVVAERCYGQLRFGALLADPGDIEVSVTGPGAYSFLQVTVDIPDENWSVLQGRGPLVLRNIRPGDLVRRGKLKDLLIDRKIPRPERRWLPLLVRAPNEVLWVAGLPCGAGEGIKISPLTERSPVQ